MTGSVSAIGQAKVRARTESQMTETITVYRGSLAALDPATGIVGGITGATVIYTGKARIHTVSGAGTIAAGGGDIAQRQVIVAIPGEATPVPDRDDLLIVGTDAPDVDMDNRALRVLEVSGGSYFDDARRLTCTMWNPSRWWAGTQ